MKPEPNWLKEMMDAALSDNPETVRDPDFPTVRAASSESGRFRQHSFQSHRRKGRSRLFIAAAAAVLAVSIAVPTGIRTGKQIASRKLILEQNTLFVEELIGGTLFDEGLVPEGGDEWIFSSVLDGGLDEDFFDI